MIDAGTHPLIAERLALSAARNQTLRDCHPRFATLDWRNRPMKTSAADPAALAADILVSMGVPACEPFEVRPADAGFVHHRVVAFDAAQFADGVPDERSSDYAARWQDPDAALPDAIRRFLAPDVPADRGQFVEYALYQYPDGPLSLNGPVDGQRAVETDFPALRSPPHQLVTQRVAESRSRAGSGRGRGLLGQRLAAGQGRVPARRD